MSPDLVESQMLSVRLCAMTDAAGQASNEDACLALETARASMVLVADGVGGHARGEVASDIAICAAKDFLTGPEAPLPGPEALRDALDCAQRALRDEIERTPRARTMRSTLMIAMANREQLWIGHVGDCRAYMVRDGVARQLTRDDTIVQSLLDMGQIDAIAARKHSKGNVLLQSIGDPKEIEYHVSDPIPVRENDVLIVCSDGLSDVVEDGEIAASVRSGTSDDMARRLVDAALARKAPDNVSVAVMVWRKSQRRLSIAARKHPHASPGRKKRRKSDHFMVAVAVSLLAAGMLIATAVYRKQSHRREEPRAVSSEPR
ncbi:MAG: PP2C family serine/threonine-protein phosphatase [Deltaproteobacteria bacterium]